LFEGDVWLLKLFRQTVPQHWPGGGKTAVKLLNIAFTPIKIAHIDGNVCSVYYYCCCYCPLLLSLFIIMRLVH